MESNVLTPGLLPCTDDEVVSVRREIAETVERCCGTVGYDSLGRISRPSRGRGRQLKPGRAEFHVVWDGRRGEPVDAARHAFEDALLRGKPIEGPSRDPRQLGLAPGDQAPLIGRQVRESGECGGGGHNCTIRQFWQYIKYTQPVDTESTAKDAGKCSNCLVQTGGSCLGRIPQQLRQASHIRTSSRSPARKRRICRWTRRYCSSSLENSSSRSERVPRYSATSVLTEVPRSAAWIRAAR